MEVSGSADYGRLAIRAVRLGFGLLGAYTLVAAAIKGNDIANFFSFFTIESNVLGAGVLVIGGLIDPQSERWAFLRGAATLYLVITGIVYAVLLAHQDVGLTTRWINDVLHRVIPIVMIADWLLFSPWAWLSYPTAMTWLAGPVVFAAYSLIRGPIVDWYPYSFLDPRHHGGYARVALNMVALGVAMALLAAAINWIARRRATPRAARIGR